MAAVGAGPHKFEAQSTQQLIYAMLSEINNLQTMAGTLAEAREANRAIFMSQFQIAHMNFHQIANQPICVLHHAVGHLNNIHHLQ